MAANLQSMFHYWKEFDLQALQKELDTTATELAARQDDSERARKHLVEQSREFKKNAIEEVRKNVAPLLKSFQAEIDNLSKRSKNAEGAFLSVYKRLIDAPDPGAVLEHALQLQKRAQKVQDLEIENKQLRETLEEYNHEFAEVKNQEVTIKNLREQLKEYEDRMEANAQARAKDKEKELQRAFAEKERQLQETQLAVAKKLGEAEHKVATLQSALDNTQSELFDLKSKYDEATSAKSDEMEMIMADLERANERAASAERTVEQLHQQLASTTQNLQQAQQMQKAPDMEQAIDILKRSSLEVELAAKEKEIAQLVEDVQRLQGTVNKLRDSSATVVAKLEEELITKTHSIKVMEDRLSNQADYEEIKRELSLLKSIEFGNSGGPEDSGIQDPSTPGTPPSCKPKTLETLLLEKNRNLQSENTQLKVSSNDLTEYPAPATTPVSCKAMSSTPSSCSTISSVSTGSNISNTEMFASMIGHELVAQYHLQNQLRLGLEGMAAAAQLGMPPNGFLPGFLPPPLLVGPPPPCSSPSTPLINGHAPVVPGHESPLERIHNIAKSELNNAQVLDTGDVSQRIRELLSSHNIGQRLFAKHVLGLSQGTVSELLSKPKHWDKLTEKGRESYRKMALWSHDENNVLALKAIAPKKGNQPVSTSNKGEDTHTEERINQILSEAQVAMQSKHSHDKNHAANAMVASIYEQELAKMCHQENRKDGFKLAKPEPRDCLNGSIDSNGHWVDASGQSARGRKPQTDSSNLTQEMVARIYKAELMKLAQAAEQSGNLAECHMYRQELARLTTKKCESRPPSQPHPPIKWEPQGENKENQSEEDKENNSALKVTIKREPQESERQDNNNKENRIESPSPSQNLPQDLSIGTLPSEPMRHNGSAFCLVRPHSNNQNAIDGSPIAGVIPTPESMSPLQRMQSIANSLMAKNNAQVANQRPLRAVLPPITQEEFDSYSNINTDDLVKKIKDGLSQFSISQRLFGESVLGLSQGSVSDLLARPKPWHMLTQKGREPFIRMQIFMADAESIPRLVATQYRIPPEQFLRTEPLYDAPPGNHVGILSTWKPAMKTVTTTTTIPTPSLSDVPMFIPEPLSCNPPPINIVPVLSAPPTPPTPTTSTTPSKSSTRSKVPPPPPPPPLPVPPMPIISGIPPLQPFPHPMLLSNGSPPGVAPPPSPQTPVPGPKSHDMPMLPIQPSVFEIAAMTNELDTVTITCRVKEVLQYHNLGQKLFGEAVLGLSQGSVSELLSKPKPWHMLSLKGREPFIKMHMWLSDPFSVDRLRIYQNELKAKRRRTSTEERENICASKKPRVYFSEEQKDMLRVSYSKDPYPNQAKIEQLADTLCVGTKTIVNWFHNHRMRNKNANSPSMVSPSTPTHSTKSEPEDWSNHSDQSQPGVPPAVNMAQWMFPSFEKVPVNGQYMTPVPMRFSLDKAQDLSMTPRAQSVEHRHDSTSSCSSLSPGRKSMAGSSPPPTPIMMLQPRGSSPPPMPMMMLQPRGSSPPHTPIMMLQPRGSSPPHTPIMMLQPRGSSPPPTPIMISQPSMMETKDIRPQVTSNRRKSSRPKWVYEGTQLDRSLHGEDQKASDNLQPQDLSCRTSESESPALSEQTSRHDERQIEAMHTDNNNDKNKVSVNTLPTDDTSSMSSQSSEDKIKMSHTITSKDLDWSDVKHQEKIQKLQQNLTTQSGTEDWEF